MAPDEILDAIPRLGYRIRGWSRIAAQEDAFLELMAGRHLILNTPTGSGKSLVALALHFKALCEGARSFYTSPIKALASEKFFALCRAASVAENVGMLTGDASINAAAPVICCTAEVLANMALRQGAALRSAPYVVMDEFHYYADRDARRRRGRFRCSACRIRRFLLMSATLGDMERDPRGPRSAHGSARSSVVESDVRPVPLDYRVLPRRRCIETVERLDRRAGKAPIYVVNFTQRECAELAQGLTER